MHFHCEIIKPQTEILVENLLENFDQGGPQKWNKALEWQVWQFPWSPMARLEDKAMKCETNQQFLTN